MKLNLLFLTFFFIIQGCNSTDDIAPKEDNSNDNNLFFLASHRGFSNKYPENTITSFQKALEVGANTLEMDVVISKDSLVVVSHDNFINSSITLRPDLSLINRVEEKDMLLYQMNYDQIKQFDVGTKLFNTKEYIPLLSDVLQIEKNQNLTPYYFIEIKSQPTPQNKYQPDYETYIKLVNNVISRYSIERMVIYSFDKNLLKKYNEMQSQGKVSKVKLGLNINIYNDFSQFENDVIYMGFEPKFIACYHTYISEKTLTYYNKQIRLIPYTVNNPVLMNEYKNLGVEGIITDCPDKFLSIKTKEIKF